MSSAIVEERSMFGIFKRKQSIKATDYDKLRYSILSDLIPALKEENDVKAMSIQAQIPVVEL